MSSWLSQLAFWPLVLPSKTVTKLTPDSTSRRERSRLWPRSVRPYRSRTPAPSCDISKLLLTSDVTRFCLRTALSAFGRIGQIVADATFPICQGGHQDDTASTDGRAMGTDRRRVSATCRDGPTAHGSADDRGRHPVESAIRGTVARFAGRGVWSLGNRLWAVQ